MIGTPINRGAVLAAYCKVGPPAHGRDPHPDFRTVREHGGVSWEPLQSLSDLPAFRRAEQRVIR